MIKKIVKDKFFLSQKSTDAAKTDTQIIEDLKDTLKFNHESCVGIAANMIGYLKNIIIFSDTQKDIVLVNPKIIKKSGEYKTIEGCLSLDGQRETVRYRKIEVKYLDENFIPKKHVFQGTAAQIIQHECDHLEGILI